jgi:hypothetical protein
MGEGRGVHRVLVGKPLGDPDVDGRIILRGIFRKWEGCWDWMERAEDRDRWRALVSTVMNFGFSINTGNFFTSCKTS